MDISKSEVIDVYYVESKRVDRSVKVQVATATDGHTTRIIVSGQELMAIEVAAIIVLWKQGYIKLPEF